MFNAFDCFAGVMTILTMTFLGLDARTNLPKVPYPTALDFFVFLSFVFIFGTIIQVRSVYVRIPKINCDRAQAMFNLLDVISSYLSSYHLS